MAAILAATILWCLDSADDNPASDCGFTESEIECVNACLGDDDTIDDNVCPQLCFTPKRVKEIQKFPLYQGK
jgi:hypothetical protein